MFWTKNDTVECKLVQAGPRLRLEHTSIEEARPNKPGFKYYNFPAGFFRWIFGYSTRLVEKTSDGISNVYYVKSNSYQKWISREKAHYNLTSTVNFFTDLVSEVLKQVELKKNQEASYLPATPIAEGGLENSNADSEYIESEDNVFMSSDDTQPLLESTGQTQQPPRAKENDESDSTTLSSKPSQRPTESPITKDNAYIKLITARNNGDAEIAAKCLLIENRISADVEKLDLSNTFTFNTPETEEEAIALAKQFNNLKTIELPEHFTTRNDKDLAKTRLIELFAENIDPKPKFVISYVDDRATLDTLAELAKNPTLLPLLEFDEYFNYHTQFTGLIIALWLKVGPFDESLVSRISELIVEAQKEGQFGEGLILCPEELKQLKQLILHIKNDYKFKDKILPSIPLWLIKDVFALLSEEDMKYFVTRSKSYGLQNDVLEQVQRVFVYLADLKDAKDTFLRFAQCIYKNFFYREELITRSKPEHRKVFLPYLVEGGSIKYDSYRKLFDINEILELEKQQEEKYIQEYHTKINSHLEVEDLPSILSALEYFEKIKRYTSGLGVISCSGKTYNQFTEVDSFYRSSIPNTRDLVAIDGFKTVTNFTLKSYPSAISKLQTTYEIAYGQEEPGHLLGIGLAHFIKDKSICALVRVLSNHVRALNDFIRYLVAKQNPTQIQLTFRALFLLPETVDKPSILRSSLSFIKYEEELKWVVGACPLSAELQAFIIEVVPSDSLTAETVKTIVDSPELAICFSPSKDSELSNALEKEIDTFKSVAPKISKKYKTKLTEHSLATLDIGDKVNSARLLDPSNGQLENLLQKITVYRKELENLRITTFFTLCQQELADITSFIYKSELDNSSNFSLIIKELIQMYYKLDDFWTWISESSQNKEVKAFFVDVEEMKVRLNNLFFSKCLSYTFNANSQIKEIEKEAINALNSLRKFNKKNIKTQNTAEPEEGEQALISLNKKDIYKRAYHKLSLLSSILEMAFKFVEYRSDSQSKSLTSYLKTALHNIYKIDQKLRKNCEEGAEVLINDVVKIWVDTLFVKEKLSYEEFKENPGNKNLILLRDRFEKAANKNNIALLFKLEELPKDKSVFLTSYKKTSLLTHPDRNPDNVWAGPLFNILTLIKNAILAIHYPDKGMKS